MRTDWLKSAGFVTLALTLGVTGCKSNSNTPAPIVDGSASTANGADPADVNMYAAGTASGTSGSGTTYPQPAKVLGSRSEAPQQQVSGEQYPVQNEAQTQAAQYSNGSQQTGAAYDQAYEQTYDQDQAAVDAGQQALYADQPPPELPEYQQPELTDPGYLWTPGYWSYASSGYYWVPGAWIAPPYEGALWTPGYWGSDGGRYRFHYGFWGPHIGFYGGINYGFGYTGSGYHGGYWNSNHFYYNTQVNRVNVAVVRNVYVHPVPAVNIRIAFNGPRGVQARPTYADLAVYHERVVPRMHVQVEAAQVASTNRGQFYAENHGRPAAAVATERFAADRTPPPAIHPAALPPRPATPAAQQQRAGEPANAGRPQPGAPAPAAAQQREQQRVQQQNAQRQQPNQQPNAQREQQIQQQNAQRQQQQVQQNNQREQQVQQQNAAREQQQQRQSQPQGHPTPEERPVTPAPAPRSDIRRPTPNPASTPNPEVRPATPAPRPESRPAAPAPTPRPESRPATPSPRPEAVPAPRPEPARPAPETRPAAAPRPAPAQHAEPAPHPAAAPHSEPGHPPK